MVMKVSFLFFSWLMGKLWYFKKKMQTLLKKINKHMFYA